MINSQSLSIISVTLSYIKLQCFLMNYLCFYRKKLPGNSLMVCQLRSLNVSASNPWTERKRRKVVVLAESRFVWVDSVAEICEKALTQPRFPGHWLLSLSAPYVQLEQDHRRQCSSSSKSLFSFFLHFSIFFSILLRQKKSI